MFPGEIRLFKEEKAFLPMQAVTLRGVGWLVVDPDPT